MPLPIFSDADTLIPQGILPNPPHPKQTIPMKSLLTLLVLVSAILLVFPSAKAEEKTNAVKLRPVSSGSQSNAESAETSVIQSEEEWTAWWVANIGENADAPTINFDNETIVAATMGMKNSGGYAVEFTKATMANNTITISIKSSEPKPDYMVTMALTSPYTIAAIPKHKGNIVFVTKP